MFSSSIYAVSFTTGEVSTILLAKLFVASEISFTISDVFETTEDTVFIASPSFISLSLFLPKCKLTF